MRPFILALILSTAAFTHAQAPIERHPPEPSLPPAPSAAWTVFTAKAPSFYSSKVSVSTLGRGERCLLDAVTPDALYCHLDLGLLRFVPFIPPREFSFTASSITSIRRPNRTASAFLGAAIGFGLGAAAGAHNNNGYAAQNAVLFGGLFSLAGAYIAHVLPCFHHTLYRAAPPLTTNH